MPSRRMIDPCFWMSETMASLTMQQRLLFIGLFSNADDQGRLRAHPSLIRSMVFPYEDIPIEDIRRDLDALQTIESVYVYTVEDKPYLQIVNWWKYQGPQWAYPSDIPPPEGWHDRLRYRRDNEVLTDNWPTKDQPEPLPNALPNALPNGDGQSDRWPHSVRVSSSVSVSGTEGADAPPATFPDWQEAIKKSKNRPATLRWMCEVLYPGLDPPDYGYIGKVARKVGGAGRLADLLWQYSTRPPTGDLLAYIQGVAKNNGRSSAHYNPHGTTGSVEKATGFVRDAQLPSGPDPPGVG